MNLEELKDQWEELESWKKLLITILFSGGIIYLIYMFVIEAKLEEKAKLEKDVSNLKTKVAYLKKLAKKEKIAKLEQKIKEIEKKIADKKKELERYRDIIPTEPKSEDILVSVSNKMNKSMLSMDTFRISGNKVVYAVYDKNLNRVIFKDKLLQGEEGVRINKISFDVNSAGDFKGLIKFLRLMKKERRLVMLDRLNLSKKSGALVIGIQFSSYFMEDK